MKKIHVGLLLCLFLVAGPVMAAGAGSFQVTLDAWITDVSGLTFTGAQDLDCPGPGNCGPVPIAQMNLEDGGTVPAIEISWMNGSGNGFRFSYYDMDEDGDFASMLTDDETEFARIHDDEDESHGDWWEGMVSAEITNITLEYVNTLNSSDSGSWAISFGLTDVDYNQHDLQYFNNLHEFGDPLLEMTREYSVDIDAEFSGFGPMVGISGEQKLGNSGLKFIADASFAFVTGETDFSYLSMADPFDLTNTPHPTTMVNGDLNGDGLQDIFQTMEVSLALNGSGDTNAIIADAMIGLSWKFDMGLVLRAGYRTALYTNMPAVELFEHEIGEFMQTRDVALSGLFVGAGWSF